MFNAITDWGNLWQAWRRAARGKRRRGSAAEFEQRVADRLIALQAELRSGAYRPGAYCHFFIREPKLRRISAAPFCDRVVHHALCNLIEPLFEARFIDHSYANRAGRGTHRAVDQLQAWAGRYRYALRGDIVQHFPSLDHALLRAKLARVIDDERVLWLADTILASGAGVGGEARSPTYFPGDDLFAACRPRGVPIGNLSSQFWSNVYLNDVDWFVQRERVCDAPDPPAAAGEVSPAPPPEAEPTEDQRPELTQVSASKQGENATRHGSPGSRSGRRART